MPRNANGRGVDWANVLAALQVQYPTLNLKLKDETNIIRESRLIGDCITENCDGKIDCSLRRIHRGGALICRVCITASSHDKNQITSVRNGHRLDWVSVFMNFQQQYSNLNLQLYDDTNVRRESRITGYCLTENCDGKIDSSLRNLYETGDFLCHVCVIMNRVVVTKQTCIARYGVEHSSQSAEVKEKIKQTCLKRYGVENAFQSEEKKEKSRQTCLKNHGVEYPMQSTEIKEKSKQACIATYGVEYSAQSTEVKDKMKQTCLQRYGVENAFQSDEKKEKIKQTCIVRYGVPNSAQCPEVREKMKQTLLKNYGVEHAMQNSEFAENVSKKAYKLKEYTLPSGNVISLQGYEDWALDYLLHTENLHEEDIVTSRKEVPECWYEFDGVKHRYYVDIYIPIQHRCIEVKSTWTYERKGKDRVYAKLHALKNDGFNVELWVYDGKKQCMHELL